MVSLRSTLTSASILVALFSRVVLGDNPINPSFPYGSTKVRGVNLGGWLVLEVSDFSCLHSSPPSAVGTPHPAASESFGDSTDPRVAPTLSQSMNFGSRIRVSSRHFPSLGSRQASSTTLATRPLSTSTPSVSSRTGRPRSPSSRSTGTPGSPSKTSLTLRRLGGSRGRDSMQYNDIDASFTPVSTMSASLSATGPSRWALGSPTSPANCRISRRPSLGRGSTG